MSDPFELIDRDSLTYSIGTVALTFRTLLDRAGNPTVWYVLDPRLNEWRELQDIAEFNPAVMKVLSDLPAFTAELNAAFQRKRDEHKAMRAAQKAEELNRPRTKVWLDNEIRDATRRHVHALTVVVGDESNPNRSLAVNPSIIDPEKVGRGRRIAGLLWMQSSNNLSGFEYGSRTLDANVGWASKCIAFVQTMVSRRWTAARPEQRKRMLQEKTLFNIS